MVENVKYSRKIRAFNAIEHPERPKILLFSSVEKNKIFPLSIKKAGKFHMQRRAFEMNKEKPIGLYVHIPFCINKCPYCDFYSAVGEESVYDRYTEKVIKALEHGRTLTKGHANTLYFGGGTPLLLGAERLGKITRRAKELFNMPEESEITAEGNPTTAGEVDFFHLYESGINRLSLGLQSSNEKELKALGRGHTARDAEETVKSAMKAGFKNISLDLMLGVPYQTKESLNESISFVAGLASSHLSMYILKIEEGTPFAKSPLRALTANEEEMAELYLYAIDKAGEAGFSQYEISNFARDKMESQHNLKYWRCEEYLGFGPSAHSFLGGERFYTPRSLKDFLECPDSAHYTGHTPGGGYEEESMLRLRLSEGLNLIKLKEKYPHAPIENMEKMAGLYAQKGLTEIKNGIIALTPKGFLLETPLIAEILYGSSL